MHLLFLLEYCSRSPSFNLTLQTPQPAPLGLSLKEVEVEGPCMDAVDNALSDPSSQGQVAKCWSATFAFIIE